MKNRKTEISFRAINQQPQTKRQQITANFSQEANRDFRGSSLCPHKMTSRVVPPLFVVERTYALPRPDQPCPHQLGPTTLRIEGNKSCFASRLIGGQVCLGITPREHGGDRPPGPTGISYCSADKTWCLSTAHLAEGAAFTTRLGWRFCLRRAALLRTARGGEGWGGPCFLRFWSRCGVRYIPETNRKDR